MKWKDHQGGTKDRWDEATRARAMEIADRDGAEEASRVTGVASGTIRSWRRRERLREEKAKVNLSGLEHIKAIGRAIVERGAAEIAARAAEPEPEPVVEEPVEEVSTNVEPRKPSRSSRRQVRRRERKRAEEVSANADTGGYAVRAVDKEPMTVDFGGGRRVVDHDSVQSQIGGRFPKGGGPA